MIWQAARGRLRTRTKTRIELYNASPLADVRSRERYPEALHRRHRHAGPVRLDPSENPMSPPPVRYASPKIVQKLTKIFGSEMTTVKVTMRNCKDVPRFIKRVEAAHRKTATAKSRLRFA